jgi:hypothetical protein
MACRSESLADALPTEQGRIRELLSVYDSFPTGIFAASMMRASLSNAERVSAAGDVVGMIAALADLRSYKG